MFKIAFPALLALNLFVLTSAYATSIWGDGGFNGFTNTLPHADRQGVEQTLGHEWSDVIFKIGFEPNRIKKADFAHIDACLSGPSRPNSASSIFSRWANFQTLGRLPFFSMLRFSAH